MPATATVVEQAEQLAREVKRIETERDEASKQLARKATRVYELEDELADAQAEGEHRAYSRAIDLLLDVKREVFSVDEALATLTRERGK